MSEKLTDIVYFGEIGNDPDEEGTLLFLNGLVKLKLANLLGVIVNRTPVLERAQVARGTLDVLGLTDVPVGLGFAYGSRQTNETLQFAAPYRSHRTDFPKGDELFWKLLEAAEDHSVALVCASGLTDLAHILKRDVKGYDDRMALLRLKINIVSIMGGVVEQGSVVSKDECGFVFPTWASTNNAHDWLAAEFVYSALQRLRVPLVVTSKWAAYAASVPRDTYDLFAETGHPVGIRLQAMQEEMIQHLWFRANLAGDDPRRENLPPVLGKAWFAKTFCGGEDLSALSGDDRIWKYIKVFNLYDQTAVMAALTDLATVHFDSVYLGQNPDLAFVEIIGINQTSHQVHDLETTRGFLISTMLTGLGQ